MKLKSFYILFLFVLNYTNGSAQSEYLIHIGQSDTIYSKILNEKRAIWVQVPESAKAKTNHPNTYPVVYVLDGGVHFLSVCAVINQLSPGAIPEMIVVGISNSENRTRDLTPKGKRGSWLFRMGKRFWWRCAFYRFHCARTNSLYRQYLSNGKQ